MRHLFHWLVAEMPLIGCFYGKEMLGPRSAHALRSTRMFERQQGDAASTRNDSWLIAVSVPHLHLLFS